MEAPHQSPSYPLRRGRGDLVQKWLSESALVNFDGSNGFSEEVANRGWRPDDSSRLTLHPALKMGIQTAAEIAGGLQIKWAARRLPCHYPHFTRRTP